MKRTDKKSDPVDRAVSNVSEFNPINKLNKRGYAMNEAGTPKRSTKHSPASKSIATSRPTPPEVQ